MSSKCIWKRESCNKAVERRCGKNIQNIFVILDNLSAHGPIKMQRELSNISEDKIIIPNCKVSITQFIEAEGGYGYKGRQPSTIQRSRMSNYGKWKNIYNKNHGRAIPNTLQEHAPLCLHIR
jgi:hypothetical protein